MIIEVDRDNLFLAAEIHSASWKDSHKSFCTAEFVEQHTPERQREYFSSKMLRGSRIYMLVDDEPIGVVSVTGNLIEDLYVLPDRQNEGHGTRLLKYAMDRCSGTPTLWIRQDNADAERLYRRMGFRATGKKKTVAEGFDEIEFILG